MFILDEIKEKQSSNKYISVRKKENIISRRWIVTMTPYKANLLILKDMPLIFTLVFEDMKSKSYLD